MIVSVNWLKKYTSVDMPIEQLTKLIGERLVEIEDVIDLGKQYEGVVIGRAIKVYKHPNADKLNVVELDDGGITHGVDRLDNGLVQVVCGAPNVREGLLVAWITPGSTVPATASDAEPFVLGARELRGVLSNGMLASGKELALNNDHEGIVEIDGNFAPGTSFAKAYELDDYLLDIENKSLTHRPDCFGLIGFAREVAAISGNEFKSPEWIKSLKPVLAELKSEVAVSTPEVTIDDSSLCPRYEAVVIKGVDSAKQSPLIIQSYLKRIGIRPISAVVDVTNYLMVTTGHPLHAFDYDAFLRLQGGGNAATIRVRSARAGETLTLLDGRTIKLAEGDILICAGDTPVGLAGAMGGAESEVTTETKNILLESATFNLFNLRTTAMRHGIFSDAVTRFTKGQPAAQTAPVLASAVRMLCDVTGGMRASEVADVYPLQSETREITLQPSRIRAILGSDISDADITQTLRRVEFTVEQDDQTLVVVQPYWRTDIHEIEDIAEEVGRLNGFDTIIPTLPLRPYVAHAPSEFKQFTDTARARLATAGANELLTYSFVPGRILDAALQNKDDAFRVVNALSPDLQFYRTSILPSLLDKVYPNLRLGFDSFALFEINKVHIKGDTVADDFDLPREEERLAFVVAAADKTAKANFAGAPFYQAKAFLDDLLRKVHIPYTLQPLTDITDADRRLQHLVAPFESKRSALVLTQQGDIAGVIGELKGSTAAAFKLPAWSAAFELRLPQLFNGRSKGSSYLPLSRYPGTTQDVTLRVPAATLYSAVAAVIAAELQAKPYETSLMPIDIYQKSPEDGFKNITFRIFLNKHTDTITTDEANRVVTDIANAAGESLGAERL